MKIKGDILDKYFKYIEKKYCYKTLDELLGKKYVIRKQFGKGSFTRMKIENGLELSNLEIDKMDMDFNNKEYDDDILEVGYCYRGEVEFSSLPDDKEYMLKEGDIFIYKTANHIDYFKFKYKNCKTMSVHMNFDIIKNAANPIWEDRLILDWQENIKDIFRGDILICEKASYDLKKIANELDKISTDNVMGYMKLKLKTIEFLATFFEEKLNYNFQNLGDQEVEIVARAKDIINKNLEKVPSIKVLANQLNTSAYKLQKGFKETTGDTVYKYIKKQKLKQAKQLLKNTSMSIMEIANEIGYENPSKFSNLFKRYNNITPLKYRKFQQKCKR